ncbi:hypothetical protein [Pseudoalteromonas gelatinilytica]
MIKNKLFSVLLTLPLLCINACQANPSDFVVIFKCHSDTPTKISVVVKEQKGLFELEQFSHSQFKHSMPEKVIAIGKFSYHRPLVTEHSMEFKVGENKLTLSDYHSEELGMNIKEKSVTLVQGGKKEYWLCDDLSSSQLPSVDDFKK